MSQSAPSTSNPRAAANAAVVEGVFGVTWFGWGQQDPPAWLVPVLIVGSVACVVVVVGGLVTFRRLRGVPSPLADPGARRGYLAAVVVELVLAFGGAIGLVRLGRPELVAGWVCVVVGVHFVPLSRVFPGLGLVGLAAVVVLVGVVALGVSVASGVVSSVIAGPGAGLSLLLHGGAQVLALRRLPR